MSISFCIFLKEILSGHWPEIENCWKLQTQMKKGKVRFLVSIQTRSHFPNLKLYIVTRMKFKIEIMLFSFLWVWEGYLLNHFLTRKRKVCLISLDWCQLRQRNIDLSSKDGGTLIYLLNTSNIFKIFKYDPVKVVTRNRKLSSR